MGLRAEKARQYFKQGYACSQAVALAFCDLTTLTEDQIASATLGFGGGFGRQRLVCGAVSGMTFIIGAIFSKKENTSDNKLRVYELVRKACSQFELEFKSLICEELLKGASVNVEKGGVPEKRTDEYYKKRPCDEIVYIASKIVEDLIEENK